MFAIQSPVALSYGSGSQREKQGVVAIDNGI